MNCVEVLVETPAVALKRFAHQGHVEHTDPESETAHGFGVAFVEADSFSVRTTTDWQRVDGRSLFVTRPGLEFTCRHDGAFPADRCLSLTFAEITDDVERGSATSSSGPVRTLTNRQAYLGHRLGQCQAGDEARVEVLAAALLQTLAEAGPPRVFAPRRLNDYARRIDRARQLMDAHYADTLSLATIARDVGMATFHFARIFRELEGVSPHRYLQAARLLAAKRALRDGASVTEACYASGFASLSHFTTTFQRHVGMRPSAFRHQSGGRR